MRAHATTGIFLDTDAINRANELNVRLIRVVFDPINPRKIEITPAVVVAAIDIKIVSTNLSMMLGSRSSDSCVTTKLEMIQLIAAASVATPYRTLKFVDRKTVV